MTSIKSAIAVCLTTATISSCAQPVDGLASAPGARPFENPMSTIEGVLNSSAKRICGEHFISGFNVEDIKTAISSENDWGDIPPNMSERVPTTAELIEKALAEASVDLQKKLVTLKAGPYSGRAKYYGDQGCVILHPLADDAFFTPVSVPRPQFTDDLFPDTGDMLIGNGNLPEGYQRADLQSAIEAAFDPEGHTLSLLVMHKGQVVIERYREDITKDTPSLNWSMGKSILGMLIGRLEQMGEVSLDDPAPIAAWNMLPGDPRSEIKIIDLMRMSGGLQCTRHTPPWEQRGGLFDEHNVIYFAPINVIDHAIYSPFKHAPNKGWQYNNCDMQALGAIIKDKISERGEDYLTWPYVELYNKIGMSGMVSELDTYGNFHLTGFDYGTARDWARYGLLYLNDGVWNGERLLSKNFVASANMAGPIWSSDIGEYSEEKFMYGSTHWINDRGALPLPRDAFWALGYGGNYAIITPSEDLVIVLLRLTNNDDRTNDQTRTVLNLLMKGLDIQIN
ncbi:MAG: serine hydrolase [Pseudomonadota bacterium]